MISNQSLKFRINVNVPYRNVIGKQNKNRKSNQLGIFYCNDHFELEMHGNHFLTDKITSLTIQRDLKSGSEWTGLGPYLFMIWTSSSMMLFSPIIIGPSSAIIRAFGCITVRLPVDIYKIILNSYVDLLADNSILLL